ncbi:MAG: thiamine ABC transporter substrate-binding protein [Acidimicrobiaceae bacterium]|nr:thiamine ABC transporter substrate-binding protein [Acidimicrobiaceae bacterium]
MRNKTLSRIGIIATCFFLITICFSCSNDEESESSKECFNKPTISPIEKSSQSNTDLSGTTIDLITYDAFLPPEGAFERFTAETGVTVNLLQSADTGTMVSQSVLTAGDPVADVMFGIDNTFLCRGLRNNIFHPYEAATIDQLSNDLVLDPYHRVTPVDYGDICVNYWIDEVGEEPTTITQLTSSEYVGQFVTQNPETSAPGMGFLLATIAYFGQDDWQGFWTDLRENNVVIQSGWTESYYGDFIAGGGDRAIVTSYLTSPIAEFIYAPEPLEKPPTAVIGDSCFRSIEFVGVLRGTDEPIASALLVDFLTSKYFQELLPETNFVLPANTEAVLPEVFQEFLPSDVTSATLSPGQIDISRDQWTEQWTQIVLR